MDLRHNFRVNAPIDKTWDVLNDIPRVGKCMPGASVDPTKKDPYEGKVSVKVGAVTQNFHGTINFAKRDEDNHEMVLLLEGRDIRGASGAKAQLSISLSAAGDSATDVSVLTELQLSGKVAQFGRKMLEDVSGALLNKFVSNLERDLQGGEPTSASEPESPPAPAAEAEAPAPQPPSEPEVPQSAPIASAAPAPSSYQRAPEEDVLDLGGEVLPILIRKYAGPAVIGASFIMALWALIRSFRSSSREYHRALRRSLEAGFRLPE